MLRVFILGVEVNGHISHLPTGHDDRVEITFPETSRS